MKRLQGSETYRHSAIVDLSLGCPNALLSLLRGDALGDGNQGCLQPLRMLKSKLKHNKERSATEVKQRLQTQSHSVLHRDNTSNKVQGELTAMKRMKVRMTGRGAAEYCTNKGLWAQ